MFTSVCSNLFIDGSGLPSPSRYEDHVNDQIQEIFGHRTGYWVLWEISHRGTQAGKKMVIRAFTSNQQQEYPEDPFPYPDKHNRDDRAAAPRSGFLFKAQVKGPGKGSDVIIHFNPDQFPGLAAEANKKRIPFIGMAEDEALFHEMLHGLRGMQGQESDVAVTGTGPEISSYQTVEDFFTILITNIYISEKGKGQLRRNHRGFDPLPDSLNTSEKFLNDKDNGKDNVRWVKYLWLQELELFSKLAHVQAAFNPLQEYAAHRSKYDLL